MISPTYGNTRVLNPSCLQPFLWPPPGVGAHSFCTMHDAPLSAVWHACLPVLARALLGVTVTVTVTVTVAVCRVPCAVCCVP